MAGFYFRHDFNASKDPKLQDLRMSLGADGYGVYWLLLEMLASNPSHTLMADYNKLGWELHLDSGKIKKVVCDFGLFKFTEEGGFFYSERLKTELDELDSVRLKRSEAGKKGNEKRWGNRKCDTSRTCEENNRKCESYRKCDDNDSQNIPDPPAENGVSIANATDSYRKPIANATVFYRRKEKKRKENNINPNADAEINNNSPRARNIEVAAAAERKVNIPPYESYSGEIDTYSPEVRSLCEEVAAKFNTFALPVHLSLLQKLILALHRPGVDAIQMVRDGLKKYDSAMAIQSKKVKFEITTFLKPEMFLRLYNGDYDTVYADVPTQRRNAPLPTSKRPIGEPSADDLPF